MAGAPAGALSGAASGYCAACTCLLRNGRSGRGCGRSGHPLWPGAAGRGGSAAVLSAYVLWGFIDGSRAKFDENVYTWLTMGGLDFSVGFLVDTMTAMMMVVVTGVSLMVHIYTIGYMHDEKVGYQRFFSYISLFTFSMLMLIMSNNFIQLFFGWEAVGLVSYLFDRFLFQTSECNI